MKLSKLSVATVVLLGTAAAHAQDDAAFYKLWGVVDVNASHATNQENGKGNVLSMGSGGMYGSRIGVNGKSAPVNGLRAIFNLEGGVVPTEASTLSFNRYALVGLEGKSGMIRGGTILKPYDDTAWNYEPMESMGISLGTFSSWRGYGSTTKTIRLDSAPMGGLKASAFYSAGGVAGNTTAKSRAGVMAVGSFGSADVLAYYETGADANGKRNQTTQGWNTSAGTMTALQGRAKFGAATVYLGVNAFGAPDAPVGSPSKTSIAFTGVGYQATDKLNLKLGAYKLTHTGVSNQGATQLALGAQYNIGVATVYGVLGQLNNDSKGTLAMDGNPVGVSAGAKQNGVKVGVVYIF